MIGRCGQENCDCGHTIDKLRKALERNTIDNHTFGCPAGWKNGRICSPLCTDTRAAIKEAQA